MYSQYLTFPEYQALNGVATASAFPSLEKQAHRRLDFFTQGRIQANLDNLDNYSIPDEVKELMALFVTKLYLLDTITNTGEAATSTLTSYSNGVETMSYSSKTTNDLRKEFYELAKEYLTCSLLYRGGIQQEWI